VAAHRVKGKGEIKVTKPHHLKISQLPMSIIATATTYLIITPYNILIPIILTTVTNSRRKVIHEPRPLFISLNPIIRKILTPQIKFKSTVLSNILQHIIMGLIPLLQNMLRKQKILNFQQAKTNNMAATSITRNTLRPRISQFNQTLVRRFQTTSFLMRRSSVQ
jgi:hypothetical protein